ncbi:MAG: enoyl-CoA hydratase/isomerase family protein, partial [Alphaproteobacteria bacterium]|nr:enoyl-CoA hydratase/isomerase family protein [Alphaproteobacteria bacterium]
TPELPRAYFKDEYGLNADLYHHEGHYIAYLNGITMGGGYGVSAHGSHLIATEATQFAMPEVKIGFFPDVGAVYHLARLPDEMGTYLALTGNTIGPADLLFTGLAEAFIPLDDFARLKDALANGGHPDEVLASMDRPCEGESLLAANIDVIARCFAHDSAEAIVDALETQGSDFAKGAAVDIKARSPLSVKIALAHIRAAAKEDFDTIIARDLRMALKFLENADFAEGVRAAVLDKDRNPKWQHATLSAVLPENVGLYFKPSTD